MKTTFNPQNLKVIRENLEKVLADFGKENGLALKIGRFSYEDDSFTSRLTVLNDVNGNSDLSEFKKHAYKFDLSESDFGKTFTYNRKEWKLIGFAPRSPKFPVIVEDMNGKKFKVGKDILSILKK